METFPAVVVAGIPLDLLDAGSRLFARGWSAFYGRADDAAQVSLDAWTMCAMGWRPAAPSRPDSASQQYPAAGQWTTCGFAVVALDTRSRSCLAPPVLAPGLAAGLAERSWRFAYCQPRQLQFRRGRPDAVLGP